MASRNWRTAIGDIADPRLDMSQQGIADPKRLAILGWSYGGYAALQSAAIDPGLLQGGGGDRAGDRPRACSRASRSISPNRRIVDEMVGSGPHIAAGSPLRHADRSRRRCCWSTATSTPMSRSSKPTRCIAALKARGKSSEYLRFNGLDHQLDDSDARAQMLTKIGQLLDAHDRPLTSKKKGGPG